MKRLTDEHWRNFDPWECCGQDKYCNRGCHDEGGCINGCIVPKLYARLAAYEDTGLEPDETAEKKTGKWIPCKKRLPKLEEEVWVTADGKSKIATLKERKTAFGDYIQEWWTEDDWIFQFEEITAWQPLYRPQPYKGE